MRTRWPPLRRRRPGCFLLALSLGLIGQTCAPPAGSDEAALGAGSYENSTPPAGLGPQLGSLTPSQYIRDFVDYVFRGKADAILDSGEDLQPENLKAANPGFQEYWPGGEWVYTKADRDYCNTTADCNVVYQKYGKVCAADHLSVTHTTFDNMCELLDSNCRDGTATTWTTTDVNTSQIQWYPVALSGVTIKALAAQNSYVFLSPGKNINRKHWVFTLIRYGVNVWDKWTRAYPNSYMTQNEFRVVDGGHVIVSYLEWNGTTGWVQWTFKSPRLRYSTPYLEYIYWGNTFPVRYVGLLGGSPTDPTYWEVTGLARGWLAVYPGNCKSSLATVPTEVPSRMKGRLDIEMYNFAGRMDEFGYNFSRVH